MAYNTGQSLRPNRTLKNAPVYCVGNKNHVRRDWCMKEHRRYERRLYSLFTPHDHWPNQHAQERETGWFGHTSKVGSNIIDSEVAGR